MWEARATTEALKVLSQFPQSFIKSSLTFYTNELTRPDKVVITHLWVIFFESLKSLVAHSDRLKSKFRTLKINYFLEKAVWSCEVGDHMLKVLIIAWLTGSPTEIKLIRLKMNDKLARSRTFSKKNYEKKEVIYTSNSSVWFLICCNLRVVFALWATCNNLKIKEKTLLEFI